MRIRARAALLFGATLWCLTVVAAPYLQWTPLYSFFSTICHQIPERSWHIDGGPLALCIRCTSISAGFLAGLVLLQKPRVRWFMLSLVVSFVEWLLAYALFDSEVLRALSGVLVGVTAAPLVQAGVEELFMKRVRTAYESTM